VDPEKPLHSNLDFSPPASPWRLGVRGKVGAILLGALFVILTINSLLVLRAQEQDVLDEINRRGQDTTHFLAQYLAYSVVGYDYHMLELVLQELARSHDVLYARVENNRGNVMAIVGSRPAESDAMHLQKADIRLNGERLGQLQLVFSSERAVSTLAERRRELLLGQLFFIGLFMLIGYVALSTLVLKPLSRLTQAVRRNLHAGDNALESLTVNSKDEFADLAQGFNALQSSLESARHKLESRIDLANRELQSAYTRLEEQARTLRESNRNLEQQTITDPLTGLYNRRYFERLMENEVSQSIRNEETLSILLLDVDRLKEINDRYGHHTGDQVLRSVAQMISSRIRLTDVACRYAGNEFFILCRRATIANAVAIADDMLHAMPEHVIRVGDSTLSISVSIGVATLPGVNKVNTADAFFQQADDALRYCKHNGGNGVAHYSMLDRLSRSVNGN